MTVPEGSPRTRHIRWDLGLLALVPEWRAQLTSPGWARDVVAGLTVAFVAVPLSMAIALASGVTPAAGLVTAVVAGTVCALFGGTRLAVSGPAAAMAVLVASIVENHGVSGLVLAALLAGALQIVTGAFRFGRFARLVPSPVVLGFTAGIGVVIIVGQLPRALGLPPPDQAHVLDVITHISELVHDASRPAIAIAFGTTALILLSSRISAKIPAHLIAVGLATVASLVFGLDVDRVGALPSELFSVPTLELVRDDWQALLGNAVALYALASLESLLSCSATDRLAKTAPHDPDQELIGQGLGTIASVALGGIPSTSVIARSGLNVAAGAKTRRAAIIHSGVVALAVIALAQVMALIPIAALAGVLFAVALGMLAPHELVALWRVSRGDAAVHVITLVAMVAFDLVAGIQVGLAIAFVIAAVRLGRSRGRVITLGAHGPYRFTLQGSITFMALARVDEFRHRSRSIDPSRGVILDLSEVRSIDVTGAEALGMWIDDLVRRGCAYAIVHPDRAVLEPLVASHPEAPFEHRIVQSEAEALRLLGATDGRSAHDRLAAGVERFFESSTKRRDYFERLAQGQRPHTMFLCCADSRISPLLLTSSVPGEVFVCRNLGNIVPRSGSDDTPAEGAAVEYAVAVLGVRQIIVCGHSSCSAITALADGAMPEGLPSVAQWLAESRAVLGRMPPGSSIDETARMNVLLQLENLRTYEVVQDALARGELDLHAWFYDIGRAAVEEWDPAIAAFAPLRRGEAENVLTTGPHRIVPPVAAQTVESTPRSPATAPDDERRGP